MCHDIAQDASSTRNLFTWGLLVPLVTIGLLAIIRTYSQRSSLNALRMAWRSSGNTNEELVNNMAKNGLIEDERVKRAMLGVSGDFVERINPTTL